jgi:hypothetical protein
MKLADVEAILCALNDAELIRKRSSGRSQDLADVAELELIRENRRP